MENYELDGKMLDHKLDDAMVDLANSRQAERTDVDDVASYESGDQITWEQDGTVLDETVSNNKNKVYKKLELAVGDFRILSLQPAKNKTEDTHCLIVKDDLGPRLGTSLSIRLCPTLGAKVKKDVPSS